MRSLESGVVAPLPGLGDDFTRQRVSVRAMRLFGGCFTVQTHSFVSYEIIFMLEKFMEFYRRA